MTTRTTYYAEIKDKMGEWDSINPALKVMGLPVTLRGFVVGSDEDSARIDFKKFKEETAAKAKRLKEPKDVRLMKYTETREVIDY